MASVRKTAWFVVALAIAALLSSCIETDAKATIRGDGSGRLELVYRISPGLAGLGELEANAGRLPFPVSESDFSRTAAGVEGLRLRSYKRSAGKDGTITVDARFDFATLPALVTFLDPRGVRAILDVVDGRKTLTLILASGAAHADAETTALLVEACGDSDFALSFELPAVPVRNDLSGGVGRIDASGRRVGYRSTLADIVAVRAPVIWSFSW